MVAPADFPSQWRAAQATVATAPAGVRPDRVALCTSLPEVIADPRHDGIALEWFRDADHLARFEAWLASPQTRSVSDDLGQALDLDRSPVVVADEVVMRGADWLAARWGRSADVVKHMAIARKAAGLTSEEFSQRWKSRAGTVGSAGGPIVTIPDEARGLAYLQNHPRPIGSGEWAYDALNEVYFESVDSLMVRIRWFEDNLGDQAETDLISESWFVACREELL